jgi:hypothetical protein
MFSKLWTKIAGVVTVAILLGIGIATPCLAISTSNVTVTLSNSYAWENCLQQGDILFTTNYTIYYPAGTPTEPVSSTFLLRLVNNSTSTDIADTTPFVYFNNGYSSSVNATATLGGTVAIYFTPAQTIASFGSQASAWSSGQGGGYYLILSGNPTAYWTGGGAIPNSSQYSSSGFIWETSASIAITYANIAPYIISDAVNLTNNWNNANYVMDTPVGTGFGFLLTTVGQDYYTSVLPNLATLAPNILISPSNAAFSMVTTTTPATSFVNQIGTDFAGSALDPTNSAAAFKIGAMWLGIILSVSIILFTVVMAAKRANTYKATILIMFPMLYAFVRIGWFPMLLALGFGLFSAFLAWYVLFYEKQIT